MRQIMIEPRVFPARVVDATTAKTLVPVLLVPAKDTLRDLMWRVSWACREFTPSSRVGGRAPSSSSTLRLFVQPTWPKDGGGSKTTRQQSPSYPVHELVLNECFGKTNIDLLNQAHTNTNNRSTHNREHVDLFVLFDQECVNPNTRCLACGTALQDFCSRGNAYYWLYTNASSRKHQQTPAVMCRPDFLKLEPRLQRLFVALPYY